MRRVPIILTMLVAAIAVAVTLPPHASAVLIDDIDDDFTIYWSLAAGGSDNDGGVVAPFDLSANALFDVISLTSTGLTVSVKITNTTAASNQAAITSLGLGVTPNATSASLNPAGAVFDNAIIQSGQQNFPGGFKQIDVCVFPSGCSGGSINEGLQSGGSTDIFTLVLGGNFGSAPSLTLDPFPVKYQTSGGSFEFGGTTTGGTSVPEPATLVLLGAALLVGGMARSWGRRSEESTKG